MGKQALRKRIWRELEARGVVTFPKPARGRIPNFMGSERAAKKLRRLEAYRSAKTIMINPDAAQLAVRELALRDGKRLLIATPKLRKGFILFDPSRITDPREAVSIKGAFKHGRSTDPRALRVELIVEGSVAVDLKGGRLGKGGGFGDLEVALLKASGAVTDATPIVTTVHELQVVEKVPMTEHDAPVDVIVTPERVIEVGPHYPKPGVIRELLPSDAFKRMPVLAEVRG